GVVLRLAEDAFDELAGLTLHVLPDPLQAHLARLVLAEPRDPQQFLALLLDYAGQFGSLLPELLLDAGDALLGLLDLLLFRIENVKLFVEGVLALGEALFGLLELLAGLGVLPLEAAHRLEQLLLGLNLGLADNLVALVAGLLQLELGLGP